MSSDRSFLRWYIALLHVSNMHLPRLKMGLREGKYTERYLRIFRVSRVQSFIAESSGTMESRPLKLIERRTVNIVSVLFGACWWNGHNPP